jgi:hypothetical protein
VKQLFHIKPESEAELVQPVLAIRVGDTHCSFAVVNKSGTHLHELAYYTADEISPATLKEMITNHSLAEIPFYKVLVAYDQPFHTLVPSQYYREGEAGTVLRSLFGVNGSSAVIAEAINEWQVYNLYAVSKEVYEWVNQQFKSSSSWNQFTVGIRQAQPADSADLLLVDLRTTDFTVIVFGNRKLLLTQTYSYQTPEDVIYYLLGICERFNLSQQKAELAVSGLLDENSALYKELYQYFIHIQFRSASWQPANDTYPAHFFTSLNDLARCVS